MASDGLDFWTLDIDQLGRLWGKTVFQTQIGKAWQNQACNLALDQIDLLKSQILQITILHVPFGKDFQFGDFE